MHKSYSPFGPNVKHPTGTTAHWSYSSLEYSPLVLQQAEGLMGYRALGLYPGCLQLICCQSYPLHRAHTRKLLRSDYLHPIDLSK